MPLLIISTKQWRFIRRIIFLNSLLRNIISSEQRKLGGIDMVAKEVMSKASHVMDMFDLKGKVAIITGGARGLGQAIAFALANAGADIAIADIAIVGKTQSNNLITVDEIKKIGRRAIGVKVDVTDEKMVEEMVDTVVNEFGHIDILVNSAGYAEVKKISEFPLEVWEKIMDINVKGVFLVTQKVVKHMLNQKSGKVINISSLQGFAGRPGDPAYSASKAAVNLMTKSMACEWAKDGICVNAISPTWCWTDLTAPQLNNEEFYAKLQQRIPMGRAGEVEDLFGIGVFLASAASDYITGAIIPVDGGAIASDGFPLVPMD
jgi:NAD(P)-dependent dehydrogenase (short-subunit alcohol dehydrogenase family)